MKRVKFWPLCLLAVLFTNLFAVAALFALQPASVELLVETDTTIIGQPFDYPQGNAKITGVIVTVPPGVSLQKHHHPVPVFGYMLQGELVINYGSAGERVYRKGDAFVEAIDWPHQGRNGGQGNVKILVVYAGSDEVDNTVLEDE